MSWADFDTGFDSKYFNSKMAVSGKPGGWEGLRKRARNLENDIDVKLVSYSKLGTSLGRKKGPEDKQPLISQTESVEKLGTEIELLIDELSKVNNEMSEFAGAPGSSQSAAIHHTLQRHTEILQDYRQEFRKTAANITSLIEREDLLSSVQTDISDFRNKDKSRGTRMDALLRESEHTRNSERLIDEQINIALETRENLVFQRETIKAFQKKLNDLTNKFPVINSLVNRITLRKRRDTIILGAVVGFCLVFFIWWIFG
ncbi:Golgi SNAP receptor complex member 1 [Eurytemora carolleeae]|uniref:Golgi SNAP receptor complex member 1 n=1 Tax=Eurytemora carolleeae TaxID=1294199 RepID=UPI000C769ADE|nr:Golgi SNAP receptor complex member 1 [Eurytemora carolleeae]|eukprot:XP_023330017.1 Golgi SNAP receptor complex member 1-like [Eurytemora affinis]